MSIILQSSMVSAPCRAFAGPGSRDTPCEAFSHLTDDIASWFIEINYDGASFLVRHAYFTGAGEPYEKLKHALRAEIDETARASLYSTTSRPFAAPETGRIAVKVTNHYGDEVLKVYEVLSTDAPGGLAVGACRPRPTPCRTVANEVLYART